ncbi:hypothetical protein MOQ_006036, partial [Trypanosoma cruzi marinkellei]
MERGRTPHVRISSRHVCCMCEGIRNALERRFIAWRRAKEKKKHKKKTDHADAAFMVFFVFLSPVM